MPKPQPRDTPVDNLKQNYEYGKNIEQQYEQLEIFQSKFGLQNNPIKTTKPEIRFAPRKVYWWLAILDTVIESNRSGYDIFNQLVTLHQLYDNVDLSCNKTKTMLKIAVLVGIKTGVIRSDEISVTENPIGETDSLSEEGTEQIKLADPRENPHIYINEDYAHHYLSFEGWQEILTSKKYVDISGLKYSTWLYKSFPLEYDWSKHFKEDNVNCTQVVREAVAQAAIGMGESAGVVDISSEFVRIPLNYVFVLKDRWSDIASEDGVGNKGDIIRTLERYRQKGGGEFYFKIFKFMNIIYPDDETEGGYRLQDPTTNEGPELVNVSIQRCKPALTYEPPESPPASFDPDKYAVDQFINAHTTVGSDSEPDTMRVTVDQLMDTFDVWAKLNDIPLEELVFGRSTNMRKGKMKQLLKNEWNIEKASARMDGDIVRVYRPLELDSAVTKLAADIDTAA